MHLLERNMDTTCFGEKTTANQWKISEHQASKLRMGRDSERCVSQNMGLHLSFRQDQRGWETLHMFDHEIRCRKQGVAWRRSGDRCAEDGERH